MAICHVIYVSTATEPLSVEQLLELLDVARRRNERLGLTGLLLYSHGRFMQVLEGPELAVIEVFGSIQKDPRHKNIDTLRFECKQGRNFPDWRMGFRNHTDAIETLPFVSRFLDPDFDTSQFDDDANDAYRALLAFRNAHDD